MGGRTLSLPGGGGRGGRSRILKTYGNKDALKKRILTTGRPMTQKTFFKTPLPEGFIIWNCPIPAYDKTKGKDQEKVEHVVDVVPYIAGAYDPISEEGEETYVCQVEVHMKVGSKEIPIVCLRTNYGDPCPSCENQIELRKKGVPDEVWKALNTSTRCSYNIVNYDTQEEREKGVQVFPIAYFFMEEKLKSVAKTSIRAGMDQMQVDPVIYFPHPKASQGRSVSWFVSPTTQYPKFDGHRLLERNYDISNAILEQAWVLDEHVWIPSYDEFHEIHYDEDPEEVIRKRLDRYSGKKGFDEKKRRKELEAMDQDDLEDLIDDRDELDIDYKSSWDVEDFVDEILEAEEKLFSKKKENRSSGGGARKEAEEKPRRGKNECPFGYEFGDDHEKYDECEDDCPEDTWAACAKAHRKSKKSTSKRTL